MQISIESPKAIHLPTLPPWVTEGFGWEPTELPIHRVPVDGEEGTVLLSSLLRGPGVALASYRWPKALDLDAQDFEDACYRIYCELAQDLKTTAAQFPVRLWNFIPHILQPLGDLEHRYMVFNAGRFRGLRDVLGEERMPSRIATASGVGHFTDDLWIHCLSAESPGVPIENPRQRPAYRYSSKFGPLPPCFARATRWEFARADSCESSFKSLESSVSAPAQEDETYLLVGGTASVRGEESCHDADLRRQLDETLYNLAAVVRAHDGTPCAHLTPEDVRTSLRRYRELRAYIVDPEMAKPISDRLRCLIPESARIEFVHADLCRPELLVEIEGVAL